MLISSGIFIIRYNNAYNASSINIITIYIIILIRRQCSILRFYINNIYNTVNTVNINMKS